MAESDNSLVGQTTPSKVPSSNCCQDSDCRGGQFVTHFQSSFRGLEVQYCGGQTGVGKSWTQERKKTVGVIDGYERGFLKLIWRGEEKVKKFQLILSRDDSVGYFQFQFCCKHYDTPQVKKLPVVSSSKSSKKFGLDGKFVTHFSESIKGKRVRYCGETGVGKNWSEERKKRVGIIEGFQDGYLKLKWEGEQNVKKFLLVIQREVGPEYQFKFSDNHQKKEFESLEEKCSNCQSSQCRSGSDYEGFEEGDAGMSLRYVGPDKTIKNKVGVVQSGGKFFVKEGFRSVLSVRWDSNQTKISSYRVKRGISQFNFKIYCDKKSEEEKDKKELKGDEEFQSEDEEDPEEPLILLSDPTAEIMDIENEEGEMAGGIKDVSDDDDGGHHSNPSYLHEDMKQYSQESLISLPNVPLALKKTNNPDVDIEEKPKCPQCTKKISKCRNGKFITFYNENLIGKRLKFWGNFDEDLKGVTGTIKGFLNGCFVIIWDGETQKRSYPYFIQKSDDRDGTVEYQFQYHCVSGGARTFPTEQEGTEPLSHMKWLSLKAVMACRLPHIEFDTDSGEEKCNNCGAAKSRCFHDQYLLSAEDAAVSVILKFVGDKESLHGVIGCVYEVQHGYFKLNWEKDCSNKSSFNVTSSAGDGSGQLLFKFHCIGPDTNFANIYQEQSVDEDVKAEDPVDAIPDSSAEAALTPSVSWAQRRKLLFLIINLSDVADPDIKVTGFPPKSSGNERLFCFQVEKDSLHFKGTASGNMLYEVNMNFLKDIDPEKTKYQVGSRCIEFSLEKAEEGPYWERLLKDKRKQHWLKVDFQKWKDEDDAGYR